MRTRLIVLPSAGMAVLGVLLATLVGFTQTAATSTGADPAFASAPAISSAASVATSSTPSADGQTIQTGPIRGTEKVYVSVVQTTPQTSDNVNTGMTQSAVQSLIAKMNSYWSAQSGGLVTIQLGGYETRALTQGTCAPNAALSAEESSAFGGLFANRAWRGTHNHLLVLSAESCNANSFATVGGVGGEIFSGNGIGASMGYEYLLHEFGHNLGFEHADASICTNTSSFDGTAASFTFASTVCPTREYDDYFDIMGYTVKNATPNLSSPQRIMAGWLTNYATVTSAGGSDTERLSALGGAGATQALKVVDPTSGDIFYVEYRARAGLDATSAEFNYGLQCDAKMSGYTICELDSSKTAGAVRVLRFIPFGSTSANGTTVLATGLTAGSTDKTRRHTHLNAGNSFAAVDGGFTLKVLSTSASAGAVVSITFGGASAPAAPTPPKKPTVRTSGNVVTAPAPFRWTAFTPQGTSLAPKTTAAPMPSESPSGNAAGNAWRGHTRVHIV